VVGWRHDRHSRGQEGGGRGALREVRLKRLDLFGSAAGDGFDPEASDLDFVVSFERRDPPELFDRYFGLKEDLEGLFGRGVDLVTEDALLKDPDFAGGISGERVSLYAA
jgi:predicted nucleotidyltransferase